MSTPDISKAMGHKVCKSTVSTILSKSTLSYKKFEIRPPLTKKHIANRLKCCNIILREEKIIITTTSSAT